MRSATLFALSLCLGLSAPAGAAPAPKAAASPELAKRLLEAVRVAADDAVLVRANAETLALAELVAAEATRAGASVSVEYMAPAVVRSFLTEAADSLLERVSPWDSALAPGFNVVVQLGQNDDPGAETGVDPVRLARARRARLAEWERFYAADVRRVVLGNAAFPTEAAARFYKADAAALARTFWDAVAVPAAQTTDRTDRLRRMMNRNHVVRITNGAGTELELRLASRPLFANVGLVTDEMAAGRGARDVALPAGEVVSVPTEFFANGRLHADVVECGGTLVKNLKLVFKEGKATLDGGGEGYEAFKKGFDLASGDKAVIGAFGIGTNAASKPSGYYRSSEMAGVVTIAIGYNRGWGGTNSTGFKAVFRLADATVKVDDTIVVDKGALKLK